MPPPPPESDDCLGCKEDNLHTAEEGRPCEQSKGAADETDLCLRSDLHIPLDHVVGRSAVEDLDEFQGVIILPGSCKVWFGKLMSSEDYLLN